MSQAGRPARCLGTGAEALSQLSLRAQILAQLGRKAEAQTEFATVRRLQSETAGKLERQISGDKYRDPQLPVEEK